MSAVENCMLFLVLLKILPEDLWGIVPDDVVGGELLAEDAVSEVVA